MRIVVDGNPVDIGTDITLLHALTRAGFDVPSLCDDTRLEPYGECRMCLVRVDGNAQPVAACMVHATEGMRVETAAPDLEVARHEILEMLGQHYPAGAAATGEPLHDLMHRYGVTPNAAAAAELVDDTHPCIAIDMNRCIDCFRCVRICDEVQGQFAWQIVGRGAATSVVPSGAPTLLESPCVACGACVDTCPTGALEDRSVLTLGPPTAWTRTTCPYCGVGCELLVGTRAGEVVTAVPAADAPVNRGHACVKGRYAHGFVASPERVTEPMLRDGDGWRTASWEDALAHVARALDTITNESGSSSVGVLASARATNEENYLLQKFARVVLGTNNVDCCARVCHAPSATALRAAFGTGAATNSFADIELAGSFLLCGTNTTENHPVVGARIKQAVRRGAALVVVDPRRIELAEYADVHLRPRPGTNVLVFNAIAAAIIDEGLVDNAFVADRVDGLDEFAQHVVAYAPELIARDCGLDAADIRRAARTYATRSPGMAFHGLGVTEHSHGTDGVTGIANLALLTGNVGRAGAGVNPLRGQNNVQGSAHMGCEPDFLPGFAPLAEAARFARVWGVPPPSARGLDAMEMLDAAALGAIRALWVVGWDIAMTQPNMRATAAALERLDLLVVQDLFLDETARRFGTVFLPACSAFEKDGTFMNGERRVQRVRAAIEPVGSSRADWQIVCELAAVMGHGAQFGFADSEAIWDEVRRVWPAGAGLGYERLERAGGLQWPCPTDDHPGTTVLHVDEFGGGVGRRARLQPLTYRRGPEQPDADYPFVLMTGRALEQFNAGTMTGRSLVDTLRPTDRLELAPADADALGVHSGDAVRVTSRYGTTVLPAIVTDRVSAGEVFATFHDPTRAVNDVTGPFRDERTNTPEYKVTAVRLEVTAR